MYILTHTYTLITHTYLPSHTQITHAYLDVHRQFLMKYPLWRPEGGWWSACSRSIRHLKSDLGNSWKCKCACIPSPGEMEAVGSLLLADQLVELRQWGPGPVRDAVSKNKDESGERWHLTTCTHPYILTAVYIPEHTHTHTMYDNSGKFLKAAFLCCLCEFYFSNHFPTLILHSACQADGTLSPWDLWVEFLAGREETPDPGEQQVCWLVAIFAEGLLTSYLYGMQSNLGRTELLMRTPPHSLGSSQVRMRFPQVIIHHLPLTCSSFFPRLVFFKHSKFTLKTAICQWSVLWNKRVDHVIPCSGCFWFQAFILDFLVSRTVKNKMSNIHRYLTFLKSTPIYTPDFWLNETTNSLTSLAV